MDSNHKKLVCGGHHYTNQENCDSVKRTPYKYLTSEVDILFYFGE
jgi:hypothetical protein